ncbi:GEVED domain-containing protein [Adhaeribacter soli]|uniref:PKD domain-containing protein n=1 Tax=Adhaeribacter soli TaxID=2607655 RepID=A0A5N1IRX1_9BACT|nr:GEVED domain-containing protein [Adhaeribacter soli]KAA9332661.1 PKD domain-containing protein [Adhaeribacter soli]
MRKLLTARSFTYVFAGLLALLFNMLWAHSAAAQCPTTACVPGNAPAGNLIFGMGILNVNVNNGAINKTSPGATDGYQDYACTTGTSLTAAVAHPISIQTNPNVNENVRVWIDYNNDGIFHVTNELAFSSINNILHTGTITIPTSAVTNTPLRMRIAADNFSSPLPTPCFTPQYSQVEDYRITVTANTSAPAPEFSASATTTCNSTVSFTDLSANGPTSWTWNFGDPNSGASNTSTLQNPTHTFSAPGTYTITLTACNAGGCNTVTKTSYITYHNNVPVAATCTPATSSYCCGYGITNVNFGNGLMTNTSVNGQAGYQDFTCSKSVTVTAGNSYPISLTSGTNPQDTRIYIDLNNDGSFTGSNEMVFQLLNQVNPSGSITIPGTTFLNTPLRMRIVSDEIGSAFNSCSGIQSGQAEDYTIRINPNPNPPVAQFTSNYASACDTIVRFTDQSTNAPTSWAWDFGDPASGALNTSTLPNPVHIYHTPGTYTVTLVATNSNGPSTQTKTNYVTIVKPCLNYCPSNGHNNTNIHISNVTLSNLNNTSGQAPNGYSNFTAQTATLLQGNPANLSVSRGGGIFNTSVSAWIDFNRNGIFETTERVMAQTGTTTTFTIPVTVPGAALIGPTRMRVMISATGVAPTNPCLSGQNFMEVEDYTISVQTNQQPPVIDFLADSPVSCNGVVQFTDNTINLPTAWLWNFGDPASGANNTSTLQHPTHTYATTGLYTVTLTATNAYGTNTVTKNNFINHDPTNAFCTNVIMPATGTGPTATLCAGSIFDPGGPNGFYSDNADGITTIAPSGAATVTLTFSSFNLESNFDFLQVFDGPNTGSPLIGSFTGNMLPPAITSTSSALTLRFTSDGSAVRDGFAATWSCTPVSAPPVANLRADLNNICTGLVSFQDVSTNSPNSWTWDFGDGSPTSTLRNPTHTYPTGTAANYTVTLTTCNSFGCHTVTKTNFINVTVPCLTYCPSNGHNNNRQWINNVTFGTINNNTGPELNGYANYTYLSNNIMLGTAANPINVRLGNNNTFGSVVIWIDFNKDGTFQPTERVLNEQAMSTGFGTPLVASGNIAVPSTAQTGPTRMRIILTQNSFLNDPCTMNQFMGETEDYTINIQPNTLPTVANFTANLNTICTGTVQFSDASTNGATSWTWDFGDGSPTSNLQNPTHTYQTGTATSYNVTLTACKGTQCNTVTKNNFINITVPCRTYCASSGHNNTDQWISNVQFGTINNPSSTDPNGYGNYTYLSSSHQLGTSNNPITVTLGNNNGVFGNVTAWIDFNKDGIFANTEKVLDMQATNSGFGLPIIASGNISLSSTALTGPTRMRVIMSPTFSMADPCVMNQFLGETEDYTINIQPNTLPTAANFTANLNTICTGVVQFSDASTNGATSWTWNFGDGSPTSNLQNPTHTYQTGTAASYNVTLTACKGTQCNTVTKNNFINISVPCRTYCASSGHNNTNQWISKVEIGSINNTTAEETNGYGNYSYLSTDVMLGTMTTPLTVTLGNNFGGFEFVAVWIDLNKDGSFQASERVMNTQAINTGSGNQLIATANIGIPSTTLPGRTRMRVILTPTSMLTNACIMNQFMGETEDYTINILPNTLPTVANFTADLNTICTGIVQFSDASTNGATSWTWNFGDGSPTSNLQNPTHTYQTGTAASYNVTLTACKGTQCNTVTKNNYINITVPCRTYCASTGHNNTDQWIGRVQLGNINNLSIAENNGYGNYSHLSTNMLLGSATNPVTVTLGNNNGFFGDVVIWIDFNRDGSFSPAERVLNIPASSSGFGMPITATGNISIPLTGTTGPTRMRVILTQNFNLTDPCVMNQFMGETEDYTVNIQPNTLPTVANFTADLNTICTGIVQFSDASTNGATSWTWNFGDGSPTSNLQNPTHTYQTGTAASYNVTLTACKGTQCNTVTKNNFINITVPCRTYCASSGHDNTNQWISKVEMGLINNATGADPNAYGNYTYLQHRIIKGTSSPIAVTLGNNNGPFGQIAIWIDFNQNGSFQLNERVINAPANSSGFGTPMIASGNILIPATALSGTTRMRIIFSQGFNLTNACVMNQFMGETEDYTINILPSNVPPIVNFSAAPAVTCNGQVNFTDLSTNNPTTWTWDFGDGSPTSSVQNPTHTYTTQGTYTVALTVCNSFGCETYTRNSYVVFDQNNPVCLAVNMPATGTFAATTCSGSLYDNGGPTGNYTDGVNSTVVIAPTGATSVALTFTAFSTEMCCDRLVIHDGPSTASPVIGTFAGFSLPNNGQPIISTGNALTLAFTSDFSMNEPGFAATWTCSIPGGLPNDLNLAGLDVFPNPTTGIVNLRLNNKTTEDYRLEVMDVVGKVLMQQDMTLTDKAQTLNLSALPKGVYFIKVQNKHTSGIRRIVLD